MRRLAVALLRDERGQDVIEYALVTASIGIAGISLWPSIETAIRNSYIGFDQQTQYLHAPPDPSGGGS